MSDERKNSGSLLLDVESVQAQFEELVDEASEGNTIVIKKEDKPIAKLVPLK